MSIQQHQVLKYFKEVQRIVKKYGGLLIIDEVQTAWGRTGEAMFGISYWEAISDLIQDEQRLAPRAITALTGFQRIVSGLAAKAGSAGVPPATRRDSLDEPIETRAPERRRNGSKRQGGRATNRKTQTWWQLAPRASTSPCKGEVDRRR